MDYSKKENIITLVLDGEKIKNKEQLLTALSKGLSFPDYFGFNWDALQDCITDLSWLQNHSEVSIVVKNSCELMSDEPDSSLQNFAEIMDYAVSFWKGRIADACPLPGMEITFSYSPE